MHVSITYSLLINSWHNLITKLIINDTPSSCRLNSLSGEKNTHHLFTINKIIIGSLLGTYQKKHQEPGGGREWGWDVFGLQAQP